MNIFDISPEKMKETSSVFTLTEINQQPSTWKKTCAQIAGCKEELQAFLDQVLKAEDFDIVLTGAGTSEFVGNSLYQALNGRYGYKVKSYATTDIVPSPENFLSRTKPTILVSFGRSGNSPESIGAVEAAEVVCKNLYHLFVTCNHEGSLSQMAESRKNCFALNLTPETHDQSFAMTSSFSNMYMATYLAWRNPRGESYMVATCPAVNSSIFRADSWETPFNATLPKYTMRLKSNSSTIFCTMGYPFSKKSVAAAPTLSIFAVISSRRSRLNAR